MSDGFGLGLRINGAVKKPIVFEIARELDIADLLELEAPRGTTAPVIKQLRQRHHALARLLAQGTAEGTAAIMCGYSNSRVSILKSDTSFKELIEFYRGGVDEAFIEHKVALAELGMDALEDIREKMETGEVTLAQSIEIAKLALDRSGFGPSSKTEVDVKHHIADRMSAARDRLDRARPTPRLDPVEDATIIEGRAL